MTVFVMRKGKLVNKASKKGSRTPYVISDEMPETRHMATGEYLTSKSKFRQATKASGCIEVGNETATLLKPRKIIQLSSQDRRAAIRHSIQQLMGKS